MNLVFKAMAFAEKVHRGRSRKYSDSPYFLHPLRVAYRVQNYNEWIKVNDEDLVCAALLHDVAEDCGVSFQTLQEQFNKEISYLVFELTQPDKLSEETQKLPRVERHKLLLEKLKSVSKRAKIIKYYDRLDNLSDVDLSNKECYGFFKKRYLQESYDILNVLKEYIFDYSELNNVILNLAEKCKVQLV